MEMAQKNTPGKRCRSTTTDGISSDCTPMPVVKRNGGYPGAAANIALRNMATHAHFSPTPSGNPSRATNVHAPTTAAATSAGACPIGGFRVNLSTVYLPHPESLMATSAMPHECGGEVGVGIYSTQAAANAALYRIFKRACGAEGTACAAGILEESRGGLKQRCAIRDDAKGRVDFYWTAPISERWKIVEKVEGKSVAEGSGGVNRSASSPRTLHGTPDGSLMTTGTESKMATQSLGPKMGTELVLALSSERLGNPIEDASASFNPSYNPGEQGKRRIKLEDRTMTRPLTMPTTPSSAPTGPAPAPVAVALPPPPRPDRISAIPIHRGTPRAHLPCMVSNTLGAPPACDPARVFTAEGRSCEEGCRDELASRLSPIVLKLAPMPVSLDWLQVMQTSEIMEHSTQSSDSTASRQKAAKAMLTEHVVALMHHHGLLLASNHCVLLHRATELGGGGGAPTHLAAPERSDRSREAGVAMALTGEGGHEDRVEGAVTGGVGAGAGQGAVGGMANSEEDRAMLNLLLQPHPNREMNAMLLPAVKTLRNLSGLATWVDFDLHLRAAAELTFDLGLGEERHILETTMFRGQRLLDGGADARQVLFMFTEKLPNAHGVDQATLDSDLMALKAIVEASGGFVRAADRGSGLATPAAHAPLNPPPPLANNGMAAHPSTTPCQDPRPRGAWTHIPPVAAYQAAVVPAPLPHVVPRSQRRGGQSNASMGGRGFQGPPKSQSSEDMKERHRFNSRLQLLQQAYPVVEGGPTCYPCQRASRNPNHHHTQCAFSFCSKCKRGGHRSKVCPNIKPGS